MADHDRVQDPGEELADEGIPQVEGQIPGKVFAGDTHDGVVPPRTFPLGAEEYGTTAAEQRRGDSVEQRAARETPERERPNIHAGRLVEPGGGEGGVDGDVEKQEIATTAGYDDGGYSAEEQAVHVTEDPPGLT
jgi:hypothetical protein